MPPPQQPKIYHIVHYDRLASIIADGCLWSDAEMQKRQNTGTTIGMNEIKQRRRNKLLLSSHSNLYVGQCVPFYFCPRSVMLFVIHMANHNKLDYKEGQGPIVHLEADFTTAIAWAEANNRRWAFTRSNASRNDFEDYANTKDLQQINWDSVQANDWRDPQIGEAKQAEFLIEHSFPWHLVERIGTLSTNIKKQLTIATSQATHQPRIEIKRDWYY